MPTLKAEHPKPKKLDVRLATKAAFDYFHQLFPDVSNCTLEEVELSKDEKFWFITLGFDWQKPDLIKKYSAALRDVFAPPKTKYKVFKVNIHTGQVEAMKIRSID